MKHVRSTLPFLLAGALLFSACSESDTALKSPDTIKPYDPETNPEPETVEPVVDESFCDGYDRMNVTAGFLLLETREEFILVGDLIDSLNVPAELEDTQARIVDFYYYSADIYERMDSLSQAEQEEVAEKADLLQSDATKLGQYWAQNCELTDENVERETQYAIWNALIFAKSVNGQLGDYSLLTTAEFEAYDNMLTYDTAPSTRLDALTLETSGLDLPGPESWLALTNQSPTERCYSVVILQSEQATTNPAGETGATIYYGTGTPDDGCDTSTITEWSTTPWGT